MKRAFLAMALAGLLLLAMAGSASSAVSRVTFVGKTDQDKTAKIYLAERGTRVHWRIQLALDCSDGTPLVAQVFSSKARVVTVARSGAFDYDGAPLEGTWVDGRPFQSELGLRGRFNRKRTSVSGTVDWRVSFKDPDTGEFTVNCITGLLPFRAARLP